MLVSEPYLPDPNFERTIILLCENNAEGSLGFVLNKPSLSKLSDLIEDSKNFHEIVCVGGPVQQDTLHYIHRQQGIEGSIEVADGIFWGGEFDEILSSIQLGKLEPKDIKFYLGYSGWSPGQLDEELKANSWIVSDHVSQSLVFETEYNEMWKKVLKEMGGRFSMFANYPVDPQMN